MENNTENCTLTIQQATEMFTEYNLFISAALLFFTIILQYGYSTRVRLVYIVKIFFMWLFWPLSIAAGVISCVYRPNMGGLVAAIILTILSILTFTGYWIQSLRLFKRCRSFWALNPESNCVGTITLKNGKVCHFSVETVPMVLAPIIKAGNLYCEGQWLTKCTTTDVPQYMYVCTPDKRNVFKKVQAFTGDSKLDKKQFATFIFVKESIDSGDLETVATSGDSLYA
uniref:Membrane protein n=1 Tax=Infectious bronchitis virus TaxID=11120 RepID=A4ZCK6_9GAMC|nr:membrane protein [Infectious bronchitis virus]APP92724.1 membrane glycoprotein [Infectious bronchitis virus]